MIGSKEKKAMEAIKEDMTTHLMAILPQLITKVCGVAISLPSYG